MEEINESNVSKLKKNLRELIAEAAEKYGSKEKALDAMGIRKRALKGVLYEKRSEETVWKYILIVEKFLKKCVRTAAETSESLVSISEIMKKSGGETSARGVPFVLTEKNYTPIKGYPSQTDIEFAIKNIQLVRFLLNVFSQFADDAEREKIRKAMGAEIEELFQAMKIFSNDFPNNVLKVYEMQRRYWEALGNETDKTDKKEAE